MSTNILKIRKTHVTRSEERQESGHFMQDRVRVHAPYDAAKRPPDNGLVTKYQLITAAEFLAVVAEFLLTLERNVCVQSFSHS